MHLLAGSIAVSVAVIFSVDCFIASILLALVIARSASTQLAASLFIRGDQMTGRRITSISELSKITGVSRPHLHHVKADDDWQGQADKLAEDSTLGFSVHSEAMAGVLTGTCSKKGMGGDGTKNG